MTEKPENPNADTPENADADDPNRTSDLRNAVEEALNMDSAAQSAAQGEAVDNTDPPQASEGDDDKQVGGTTFDLSDFAREAMKADTSQQDEMLQAAEQRASSAVQGSANDAIFTLSHRLRLELAESQEYIVVPPRPEMILGRGDKLTNFVPEIDLTDFGAYRLGLSRRHATMIHKKDRLYLKDLSSRNGTSVNGLRLEGEELRMLRHGDAIQLGNLKMYIQFIQDEG